MVKFWLFESTSKHFLFSRLLVFTVILVMDTITKTKIRPTFGSCL